MNTKTCWSTINYYLDEENETVIALHINNVEQNKNAQGAYESSIKNTNSAFQALDTKLSQCKKDLAKELPSSLAELIATALAIYTDEDILTSNLYPRTLVWPKIQQHYIGNKEGGTIFFQLLEKEIKGKSVDTLMLRTFHRLLILGFKGRYYNDTPVIRDYIYHLEEIISDDISVLTYA